MNENAKKWVAALRSGEYPQTKKCLQDKNGFCCLGVACDLYQKEVGGIDIDSRGFIDGSEYGQVLPHEVMGWLGLRTKDGSITIEQRLSLYNDEGKSFSEISDIIESEPAGLFL